MSCGLQCKVRLRRIASAVTWQIDRASTTPSYSTCISALIPDTTVYRVVNPHDCARSGAPACRKKMTRSAAASNPAVLHPAIWQDCPKPPARIAAASRAAPEQIAPYTQEHKRQAGGAGKGKDIVQQKRFSGWRLSNTPVQDRHKKLCRLQRQWVRTIGGDNRQRRGAAFSHQDRRPRIPTDKSG
jgi:hypothetical protein